MLRVAVLHPDLTRARELQFQLRSDADLQVVHVATVRERLLEALAPLEVQVAVVSSAFEGGEAFPVCQEVQVYAPATRCLVYAEAEHIEASRRMLHRGASGCVLAEDGPEVLHEAVAVVGEGGGFISSDSAFYLLGLRQPISATSDPGYRPSLSKREKDVMRAILEERTTAEIATLLNISFGTVETHRRNMLAKVGARNTAGLVRSCYEHALLT